MSTKAVSDPQPQQSGKATTTTNFTKRKPVNPSAASTPSAVSPSSPTYTSSPRAENGIVSTSTITPPTRAQATATATTVESPLPDTSAAGPGSVVMGGMAKTYEETQKDLFAKLEALATSRDPVPKKSTADYPSTKTFGSQLKAVSYGGTNHGNKSISFNGQQSASSSGQLSFQQQLKQARGGNGQSNLGQGYGVNTSNNNNNNNNNTYHGASSTASMPSYTAFKAPERPREPRRRINSAQFKTPSAADMSELVQVVVANATPPKLQNRLRKRASTLSLTATTFLPSGSRNPSVVGFTSVGVHDVMDYDFRRRYETAVKESKQWEKKYSSAQNQIHYEREKWEEQYGALEKAFKELEMSKTEANVEKMNTLLDTVKELQIANEVFRKQLQEAGVEPDPMPAARFHAHQILVGENFERTFLEEDEVLKERSLNTNQKIACLSTEINNATIAISQTINFVQLRYLTQMLDAAEHVSSQKRTRAMSNTFLSDMLSRGVKKTPGSTSTTFPPAKLTSTIATQTQVSALSSLQLQQEIFLQQNFGGAAGSSAFRPLETKLNKSFAFGSSLLNLTGLSLGGGHEEVDIMYRLKGGVMDDRSQLLGRTGIPPVIVQDLKAGGGSPRSAESVDRLTANRQAAPQPKFQYASPTTSQLRIFVPDASSHHFGHMTASTVTTGSQGGSIHSASGERPLSLRRSSSDVSLMMTGHQQQQQVYGLSPQVERVGGKYPYPHLNVTRPSSQKSTTTTSSSLHRTMSQQFLSPEMAFLYSKQQ